MVFTLSCAKISPPFDYIQAEIPHVFLKNEQACKPGSVFDGHLSEAADYSEAQATNSENAEQA